MCVYTTSCLHCSPDVEENDDGDITSFTITPLQPVFKGARTYKLGAPTEAVSATQLTLTLVQRAATDIHVMTTVLLRHTISYNVVCLYIVVSLYVCIQCVLCALRKYISSFRTLIQCLKDWCQALQDVGHVCRAYTGTSVSWGSRHAYP